MTIRFVVLGVPQPRGSKQALPIPKRGGGWATTASGRPITVAKDDNPRSKDWMNAVASAAHEAYQGELLSGAVAVSVVFYLPRIKGHYGSGKNSGKMKASAPIHHVTRPDCDKLLRGTIDALKGILWRDDSQVVRLTGEKMWTETTACAKICVTPYHSPNDFVRSEP